MNRSKYNDLVQQTSYKIARALMALDELEPQLKAHAEHEVQARVQRMRTGDPAVVEGTGLITEYVEPAPEPTPEPAESVTGSESEAPPP